MLSNLCNWLSHEFNLKHYYPHYASFIVLDSVVTIAVVTLLWLYVPLVRFLLSMACNGLLEAYVYLGDAYLGLPAEQLREVQRMALDRLNIDTLGNAMVFMCAIGALTRVYVARRIYRRGALEASERV